jgi:S-DNA-T family DNA segregation ATPase FtsK/SpoIIIE
MNTPENAAVIPADPVLDAELINDDDGPTEGRRHGPGAASWWQRSPRVPAALQSRAHAAQAAKDATVTVVRSPWRFVRAALRGTVLAIRA